MVCFQFTGMPQHLNTWKSTLLESWPSSKCRQEERLAMGSLSSSWSTGGISLGLTRMSSTTTVLWERRSMPGSPTFYTLLFTITNTSQQVSFPANCVTQAKQGGREPEWGWYLKALFPLPVRHLPPLCELKRKLRVGKKVPSVRPLWGVGGCTRDLTFENRNKQACWKFPHAQKEEQFFSLAGTLCEFCRT